MLDFDRLKVGDILYRWTEDGKDTSYNILAINSVVRLAMCKYVMGDSKIVGPVYKSILQGLHRHPRKFNQC